MKRHYLLAALLLFIASALCAQPKSPLDSLKEQYEKYPRQGIAKAEKIRTEALRTNDKALLLQALFLKIHFTLRIDSDQYSAVTEEVKTRITGEQDLPARSILHACLAQLYTEYYQRNRYKISQRTALEDTLPDNIEEWSANLFEQQILEQLTASIAPADAGVLQHTPIGNFRAIYPVSPAEDTLRPTLYDHLCHEALELIPSAFYQVPDSIAALPALLGNTQAFVAIPLPAARDAAASLHIRQELLRFRLAAGNPGALLLADLERLEATRNLYTGEHSDSLYLNALEEMRRTYADLPVSVEIIAQEAEWLGYRLNGRNALANKERALALCEEGIRKFPQYPRINLLHAIIGNIKLPGINVRFPQTLYPGEAFKLNVNSKNLANFTLHIYRIDTSVEAFQTTPYAKRDKLPTTLLRKQNYRLPASLIAQDTTLTLEGLPAGFYRLTFSAPGVQHSASEEIVCTALFAYQRTSGKKNFIRVCDLNSGKPIKDATVRIYKGTYYACQLLDSARTDARGFARLPLQGDVYQVVDSRNPAGAIRYFHKSYDRPVERKNLLEIITDRKIYRPGQTVYYKGIAWQAGTDTIFARTNTPFTVHLYGANNDLLDKQTRTSNAFGSFTGSFVIPPQTMNGSFRIEAGNNAFFIQVAEYKRPEFEITFEPQDKSYRPADTIRIKGKIMTFSGIRLDNVPIRYEIAKRDFCARRGSTAAVQGITLTNAAGEFEWSFPAALIPPDRRTESFYAYDITVRATDPKGETQSAQTQVVVHAGDNPPQIEVHEQVNKHARTAFLITLQDAHSTPTPQRVSYTIARLAAPATLTYPVTFQDTTVLETILQQEITVTGNATIYPSLNDQPSGAYLWSATCNGKTSKQIFYLYAPEDTKPPVPTYNWTVAEKTRCRPGEKARILFGTSVSDAYVLYEIFASGKLLKREFLTLSDEIKALEIPYLAEYGSRIWVSLIYVKHKNIIREGIPIDRIYDNRHLSVETQVFRDKLLPGQQEAWTLRILDESGKPVKAELLAMMYDASLDRLYRNPIDFAPDYLRMSLRQRWEDYYWPETQEYINLYFKVKPRIIPSFNFIQKRYYGKYNTVAYDFAAFDEADTEIRATAKQTKAAVNGSTVMVGSAPLLARKTESVEEEAEDTGDDNPVDYRQNFAETAFFYPQLQSDSTGEVGFRFQVPESNTRWRFIALATTPSVAAGKLEAYITTSKPLMVRPNYPRFLRSGDRTDLKVIVSNLSDSVQAGVATLEFFLPQTNQTVYTRRADFRIASGENRTLTFTYDVPRQTDVIGCRITAASGRFSDGEQQLLAVLPDEIPVTATAPFYSAQPGNFSVSLPADISPRNAYRLTLEVAANPIWYAVLALPTLQEPQQESVSAIAAAYYVNTVAAAIARANPKIAETIRQWQALQPEELQSRLSQNPELKSVLLSASPWALEAQSETEQMRSLGKLFDRNRLDYLQQQALRKLSELQHPQGGWCWFKGMPANRFMTMNVLAILAHATTTGQHEADEQEKRMQIKALAFLDKETATDYQHPAKTIGYGQLLYLYTRSLYRDIPLGDAREAHKHLLRLARKQWGKFSLYEKALAAQVFHRYGFPDDARDVLRSLKEYAQTTPADGMFWPENRQTFHRNSAVQEHAAIMEAFHTIDGNTADTRLMKQWLLRQKQTQAWGNVPSTVDAIHALLLTGEDWLATPEALTAQLGKHRFTTAPETVPLGYLKKSFSAGEIRPDMLTVRIDKTQDTPTWGSLYLQYYEKFNRIKSQKNLVGIEKQLFVEQTGKNQQPVLQPLGNRPLKVGDKVTVRLTFTLSRDMEFLHLQDLRAACFEPVEQISGTHWKFGTVYYQDVKDAATNFFFTSLPRGTYVLEYPVWVSRSGEYQDGIATFQSVYAPEYSANSQAARIRIGEE